MNINWYGQSFFRFSVQKDKNLIEIILNPFTKDSGNKISKTKADILIVSDENITQNSFSEIEGNPFFISSPGEYEIKDVFIQGISEGSPNKVFYLLEAEDIKVCFMDEFSQKELTSEQLSILGKIDILVIPVGGGKNIIEPKDAAKIISQIEPQIVIPMNYKTPGIKTDSGTIEEFLKIMGVSKPEEVSKFNIKKKDLEKEEETKIIIISPKN